MELEELAERCEQAEGPDRELDIAIHNALRIMRKSYQTAHYKPRNAKAVTATIDAALTLSPTGWRFTIRQHETGAFARLQSADFKSETWGKGEDWITEVVAGEEAAGEARTAALAICAAALRARSLSPITI